MRDFIYDIGTEKEQIIKARKEKAEMFKVIVTHFEETCGDLIYHHKVTLKYSKRTPKQTYLQNEITHIY